MADINIEKKKSTKPVWPWILAALLLIGAIWAIAEMTGEPEEAEVAVAEEQYAEEPIVREPQSNRMAENAEIESFVSYIEDKDIKERMGEEHQLTAEALMKLSAALEGLSQNNQAYSQQINEIREAAQEIQSNPQSDQHANLVTNAFSSAAGVLSQIQQEQYPDAQSKVEELQETAQEMEAGTPLTEQKDKVQTFFETAADALEEMQGEEASF